MAAWFADRPWLAQPFMPQVVAEGEYSLFYFGGRYSHAVLKTPRREDFRVQEEHGGVIQAIEPRQMQSLPPCLNQPFMPAPIWCAMATS
jgi:hypothetical protein